MSSDDGYRTRYDHPAEFRIPKRRVPDLVDVTGKDEAIVDGRRSERIGHDDSHRGGEVTSAQRRAVPKRPPPYRDHAGGYIHLGQRPATAEGLVLYDAYRAGQIRICPECRVDASVECASADLEQIATRVEFQFQQVRTQRYECHGGDARHGRIDAHARRADRDASHVMGRVDEHGRRMR